MQRIEAVMRGFAKISIVAAMIGAMLAATASMSFDGASD